MRIVAVRIFKTQECGHDWWFRDDVTSGDDALANRLKARKKSYHIHGLALGNRWASLS